MKACLQSAVDVNVSETRRQLIIASQKQPSDTHKTPSDRVKRFPDRKTNIKASEHVNSYWERVEKELQGGIKLQGGIIVTSEPCSPVSLITSHQGKPGTIPCRVTPGFSHMRIVPDDAAGWWVFSGISRFPRLFTWHCSYSPQSLSSALNTSLFRAVQIFSLHKGGSPDLNPIKHLWDELDRRMGARQARPKSIAQLMEWLQEEWRRIHVDVLQTVAESMPDRVAAVIAARATRLEVTILVTTLLPRAPVRVKRGKYGPSPDCKCRENRKTPRRPADQWQSLAQLPRAKILERPRWGSNLVN
ncbi:hypothetical protein PR048_000628 [Dryococelus australis]|uniref:Tc1-like transposase DDE domain-containing protein n=1 Tax=Dryococelus australis TaxID=614101 RepID=A0ABQ9IF67_9NEOP|nr:hypothetical protein PR048_000628 [Dryococelus australis]